MKILKLTVKNIASIEDAEIDFGNGSLADSRLFIINGPTGAGKSTVLDAICLALFRNAPRLEGLGRRNYIDSQSGLSRDGKERALSLDSPRSLIRRGCGDAMVTLEFVGNNGHLYRAKWGYSMTTRGVNKGKPATEIRRLEDVTSGEEFDKPTVVDPIIIGPDVVGLDFHRFTRTTMLAQGSFTKFLAADGDDKCTILGQLVGIKHFAEIGCEVHQMELEAERALKSAQERIKGIEMLTAERRKELTEQLDSLRKDIKAEGEKITDAEKKKSWLDRKTQSDSKLEASRKELGRLTELMQTDDFGEMRERAARWRRLQPLGELLGREKTAEKNVTLAEENVKLISGRVASLRMALAAIATEIAGKERELKECDAAIEALAPQKCLIENGRHIKALLDSRADFKSKIARLEKTVGKLMAESDEVRRRLADATNTEKARVEALKKAEDELSVIAEGFSDEALMEKKRRKTDADNRLAALRECLLPLGSIADAGRDIARKNSDLKELRETMAALGQEVAKLKELAEASAKAADDGKKDLALAEKSIEEATVRLRHALKVGEDCPVCGRRIDAIVTDDYFDAAVEHIRVKVAALENTAREDLKKYTDANMRHGSIGLSVSQLENDIKMLESRRDEAGKKLEEKLAKVGMNPAGDVAQVIDLAICETETALRELTAAISLGEERRLKITKQKETVEAVRKQLTDSREAVRKFESEIKVGETAVSGHRQTIADYRKNIEDYDSELSALLPDTQKAADTEALKKKIDSVTERHNSLTAQHDRIEREFTDMRRLHADAGLMLDGIGIAADDGTFKPVPSDMVAAEARKCMADAARALESISQAGKNLTEIREMVARFMEEHPDETISDATAFMDSTGQVEVENIEKRIADVTARHNAQQKTLEMLTADERKIIEERPEMPEDETAARLSEVIAECNERLGGMNRETGRLEEQIRKDDDQRSRYVVELEEIERLKHHHLVWDEVDSMFGGDKGKNFNSVACGFILDRLIESANAYLRSFEPRYSMLTQPGSFEILIYDDTTGHTRAFNTLSGGESFMVSLALALGLSSFQSTSVTPDIMFIDEGFGSLSADCLDSVMATLEQVQNLEGRRVGIISHVDTLRERILSRINVVPRGSKSVVTVE